MVNILNYFKDDRKKIIIVIILCIAIIIYGIIMYFDYVKKQNDENNENNSSSSNNTTAIIQNDTIVNNSSTNTNNNTDINNTTNNVVNNNLTNAGTAIAAIQKFANFCNSRDLDNAFNMLTDDCKTELYNNSKEKFESEYVNNIFDKSRSSQISRWAESNKNVDLYKVTFYESAINTGKIDESNSKNDYITAVYNNGTYKLNIFGFIKKENINAQKKNNFMHVNVINKLIFVDYESYKISVKNDILVDFTLDNMENNIKTYIQDKDGNNFGILNSEYSSESTRVSNGKEVTFNLKFDRKYSSNNKKINKLIFSRINVINRMYREEVYNSDDDTISYEDKMSTYPETLSFEIAF